MRSSLIDKIFSKNFLIVVVTIICAVLGVTMLIAEPYDAKNTKIIAGNFESLVITRSNKNGDMYALVLRENQKHNEIDIGYQNCFDYDGFTKEVSKGQVIHVTITDNKGLWTYIKSSIVIGISSNNKDYLRVGCVNNQLMGDKPIAPLLFIPILFVIGFLFTGSYT